MYLFLTRGLIAIAWAAAFAAAADSLTTEVTVAAAVLVVLYPLIDARTQHGSARQILLAGAATSAVAAVGLAVAATGGVTDVFAVFGVWAAVSVRRSSPSRFAAVRSTASSCRCCSPVACP